MVKIKTVFQLHEYKYNIKFCRWTISKSVAELSSILSVKCRQKPSLIKKQKKNKQKNKTKKKKNSCAHLLQTLPQGYSDFLPCKWGLL